MTASLSPDAILRDLSKLWVSLGKESNDENGSGVLRACTMTLVVLAEMNDDAAALGETIAALMPEHPARTIVVRLQGGGAPSLGARVFSQCWMPFQQRRQICCEQIEITVSDASLADLPAVILPLAAPDLPVVVWCRSARLVGMPEFGSIAALASKVVIDGEGRTGAPGGEGPIFADLAWTRLTRWREALAQVFENPRYLEQLPGIQSVRIAYGSRQETSARYLGAWLANGLRWSGGRAKPEFVPSDSFEVNLTGENLEIMECRHEGKLTVTVNGLSQCTNLPEATDYLMMHEELGILRRDSVFEEVLARMAE